jgi:hypothetical protein
MKSLTHDDVSITSTTSSPLQQQIQSSPAAKSLFEEILKSEEAIGGPTIMKGSTPSPEAYPKSQSMKVARPPSNFSAY